MVRFKFAGRTALSFILFNIGWWACALGAGHQMAWVGPALLPVWAGVHLLLSPVALGELLFFVLLGLTGYVVDTVFIKLELFTMANGETWAPMWMVAMWVLMGMTYEGMLPWRRNIWLLLVLGGITGPLTYVWCEAVHLLAYAQPLWLSLMLHGLFWAAATVLIFQLRDLSLYLTRPRKKAISAQAESAPALRLVESLAAEPAVHHTHSVPPDAH